MSYLTLLPAGSVPVSDWDDAVELHRIVMSMFPNNLPVTYGRDQRATAGILFRVDETHDGPKILVQSKIEPARLPAGAQSRESAAPTGLSAGGHVRLRLAANVAVRRTAGRHRRSSPAPNVQRWLESRLDCAVGDLEILDISTRILAQKAAPLAITTVDAIATVQNVEALIGLLENGVGRGKAYGCGLLSIARA